MAKLSARVKSSGALYDARSGGRSGRPFGAPPARATNNKMGTDIESVRELDRELIARGVRMRIERKDESLDPAYRDERIIARNARRVVDARLGDTVVAAGGSVYTLRGIFDPEIPDAVALDIMRRLRMGRAMLANGKTAPISQTVRDAAAERSRNMVMAEPTPADVRTLRALRARFARLVTKHGESRARKIMANYVGAMAA